MSYGDDDGGLLDVNSLIKSKKPGDSGVGLGNFFANSGQTTGKLADIAADNANIFGGNSSDYLSAMGLSGTKPTEMSGLDKLFGTDSGRAMVNAGLGVGQLGLGLASYLSNAKMLKKQGALMDQQLANNTKEMARRDDALASMNGSGAAVRERYDRAKANPTNSIG